MQEKYVIPAVRLLIKYLNINSFQRGTLIHKKNLITNDLKFNCHVYDNYIQNFTSTFLPRFRFFFHKTLKNNELFLK